jgi:uncharacterized protein YegP (UPF0339 family)
MRKKKPKIFDLKRSPKNKLFYFVFRAMNKEVIGTSEMYNSKKSAREGIDAIISVLVEILCMNGYVSLKAIKQWVHDPLSKNASHIRSRDKPFVIVKLANKQYYFKLFALNNECVLVSVIYEKKSSATKGILLCLDAIWQAMFEELSPNENVKPIKGDLFTDDRTFFSS